MGKFDGYLICSDMDNTLCIGTDVCKENIDAIKYFQDNGGLFTVSTGRNFSYIKDFFFDRFKPNTHMIVLNGTMIVNGTTGETLCEYNLDDKICGDVIYLAKKHSSNIIKGTACTAKSILSYDGDIDAPVCKLVFLMDNVDNLNVLRKEIEKLNDGSFSTNCSWDVLLEVIPEPGGKGECVQKLKELCAESVRVAIAVGDYENDLTMIKMADVGYAVENAHPDVLAVADRITNICMNGSIAKIVKDIEDGLI